VIFSNLIAMAMIVATAATLHASGVTEITAAADAAAALQPVAGEAAMALFAIGLIGGSLLAAAVLPLATAYAASEVFGRPKGVSLHWAEAPLFFWLFTALVAGGAALALVPGVPVIGLLIGAQILNGVLLPAVLGFMLVLANDRRLMGELANTRWQNLLGWGTLVLVVGAIGLMFGLQLLAPA
jgi:Mn2+/Fe2+ NRAMP family transporter